MLWKKFVSQLCFGFTLLTLCSLGKGARFASVAQSITRLVGEEATFNCVVEDKGPSNVIWSNGSAEFLSMNRMLINAIANPRVQLSGEGNAYILEIKDITLGDEGQYQCRIEAAPRLVQIYELTVHEPPSVKLEPSSQGFPRILNLQDSLEVECMVTAGKPNPMVTWSRVGQQMPDNRMEWNDERLNLLEVGPQDGGDYECRADNGVHPAASAMIRVEVHYPASVTMAGGPGTMYVGPDKEVNIDCMVTANPNSNVFWYLNDNEIGFDSGIYKEDIIPDPASSGTKYRLTIAKVDARAFGTYTCEAMNSLGGAQAEIQLSGLPHDVAITSEGQSTWGDAYELTWQAKSVANFIQTNIALRLVNDSEVGEWMNSTIPGNEGSFWLRDLQPLSQYEVIVTAENQYGLSPVTPLFTFDTGNANAIAPDTTTTLRTTVKTQEPEVKDSGNGTGLTPPMTALKPAVEESESGATYLCPQGLFLFFLTFATLLS